MQNSENEMNRHRLAVNLLLTFAFLSLSAGGAHAQWILVARRVIGRVQSMTQSPAPNTPRYDVATVLLEANADKVYQTVIATIATHKDYRTVQRNDATRNVEVSNGKLSAGIHVVALHDKVSELVIASVIPPGGESATSFAVGNVLRICQQMKVVCSLEGTP
jgi:hypothetical protein